jgi:hypothetical protein
VHKNKQIEREETQNRTPQITTPLLCSIGPRIYLRTAHLCRIGMNQQQKMLDVEQGRLKNKQFPNFYVSVEDIKHLTRLG